MVRIYIFLLLAFFVDHAWAQSGAAVTGKVYDKTINQKVKADWVVLVKTGQGLETFKQLDKVADYEFTSVPLNANAPYLLRASYKGVVYTQNLMIQENKKYNVDLVVYEASNKWQNLTVRIPHMIMVRSENMIEVQQTYEINNTGVTAYHISDASKPTFRFKIPEGAQFQNALTSHNQSAPIGATAFAYQDGMGVNFPLRPGITQIQLTYTADYSAQKLDLSSFWYYDIAECNIFVSPKDIQVNSDKLSHVHDERMEANNFSIYTASGIKANEAFKLELSGGSARKQDDHDHGNNETIAASENLIQKKSFIWIFLMFSILSLALFFGLNKKAAVKSYQPPSEHKKQNKQQKSELTKKRDNLAQQIAMLDDNFSENKIEEAAYNKRRNELKIELRKTVEAVSHV